MSISKKLLLEALEIVKPGLASKEVIEQSTSFAFMGDRIVTYNDEISISHPVEGLEIKGAIQSSELYLILKKIKQEEIEVELTETEVHLTAGRVKVGLSLQSEIRLPLEEVGIITKWRTLPDNFLTALQSARLSCSNDNNKPILNCVHINSEGFIEGSDGYQIMKTKLTQKLNIPTFLIPASSAIVVLRANPVKISIGEGWVHFKTKLETVISCRLIEDKFPDTSNILIVNGKEIIFPRTIKDILDRASIFKEGDNESVLITLNKNRIKVKSSSDTGWFLEESNIKYEEDPLEFRIVPSLLSNIVTTALNCTFDGSKLKFEGENWEFITSVTV